MKGKGYASKPSRKQPAAKDYGSFKDRNLAAMRPEKAQEALKPTEAEPVRMQHRMAGCS